MTQRPSLPNYLIQPFDVKYLRDDVHAIAFFEGHADYEAVEAMLSLADPLKPAVRAILTRHDQTQVDYINDATTFEAAKNAGRKVEIRHIDVDVDTHAPLPRVKISFDSERNERVMMEVVCASPPDAGRGGISDPGRHSDSSSLPVMSRGKSAFAGVSSSVEIAGTGYRIPEKFRAGPHFVAHHGFFTISHHMAILRAGNRSFEDISIPTNGSVGEAWVYRTRGEIKRYEIQSRSPASEITAICSGAGGVEKVKARIKGQRLELIEVEFFAQQHPTDIATLGFAENGSFSIGIDAHRDAVTGVVVSGGSDELQLCPAAPAWASARRVSASWKRCGGSFDISTSIGSGDCGSP